VPFAALWLVSLARVVWVIAFRRSFDGEDTLALGALFVLPWLVTSELRSSRG
jgi:hypothetical protein